MQFKAVNIIKFPVDAVWVAMRDHLGEIAELMEEIEEIRLEDRQDVGDNAVNTVYVWKTKPAIPAIVINLIQPEMLAWTDTAHWEKDCYFCSWHIESHYFRDGLDCQGETTFEPALGGRGCRLTFSGTLQWKEGLLSSLLGDFAAKSLEPILSQLVANNFRKIGGAVETFLGE